MLTLGARASRSLLILLFTSTTIRFTLLSTLIQHRGFVGVSIASSPWEGNPGEGLFLFYSACFYCFGALAIVNACIEALFDVLAVTHVFGDAFLNSLWEALCDVLAVTHVFAEALL